MTPDRMREEAAELLGQLEGHDADMDTKDLSFYEGMVLSFDAYPDTCRISSRQLFWLRDLRDRYAL